MPTLRVLHPDGTETEHSFEGELSIGRQAGNGLALPDGGVSRRHALLHQVAEVLSLVISVAQIAAQSQRAGGVLAEETHRHLW